MDGKNIGLVIFDLDYTLIDSSAGIVYCFNEARRRVGEAEVDAGLLIARIGLPIEDGFRVFGSRDPEGMRELFRKIARDGAMAERSFLLPGVSETLARLDTMGYRMAVASTKSRAEIERVLAHLGVLPYFAAVCGSDEVAHPKPAPDPILAVLARLGVAAERALYVGDHVVDVQAARAAGARVVAVEGGPCGRERVLAEGPDAMLASIADLPGWLVG
jgi:phosphoglycolate phosphatase